jgi:hypothetical protein
MRHEIALSFAGNGSASPPASRQPTRAGMTGRFLLSLVVASACSTGADAGSRRTTVRDSAGIAIVENTSPDDSAANTWWRLGQASLDIGGPDASEEYAVYRVVGIARTTDGRIVVANAGSADVRYYDASGTWLKTTGRQGSGPGEFRNPYLLERGAADTVYVADGQNSRIAILSPDGSFVRDIPEMGPAPRVLGRFDDGTWLSAANIRLGTDDLASISNKLMRSDMALVRYDENLVARDTMLTLPGAEQVINVGSTNGRITSIEIHRPAFAKVPVELPCGNEICAGTQDGPEIQVYGQDGALHHIIRTGRAPVPVTDAQLDAAFERNLEQMPEQARNQARAAGRGDQPHGEFVPPYGLMIIDRSGRYWLSDYDDPLDTPGRWTVYAADGAVLARIQLPEQFRPYDIGEDWILGREPDELDVEHVKLYPILTDAG